MVVRVYHKLRRLFSKLNFMFFDLASLHNLGNKANLVHNLFSVCLLLSLFINLYMFRVTVHINRRNNCGINTAVSPEHVEIDKRTKK